MLRKTPQDLLMGKGVFHASMRPQRNAAENDFSRRALVHPRDGFNEAAA